jgi:hypothetical protein
MRRTRGTRLRSLTVAVLCCIAAGTLTAADLSGTWTADVILDAGSGTATFVLKQTGETLTGTYEGTFGKASVTGTVKGDKVEWAFDADQVGTCSYTGTLQGDSQMKGTVVYGVVGSGMFTAKKK